MAKYQIFRVLLIVMIGTAWAAPVTAQICEQHDFGSPNIEYYVYSSGKAWDFTAENDMLIESIETLTVLKAEHGGTFYFRIEVNNDVVAVLDQYVSKNVYTAYIQTDDVMVTLKAGDKITFRIYGNFNYLNMGSILGPNYIELCGVEGISLFPSSLQDDFLTLVHSFDSPHSNPYGLAFDGTYLWHMGQYGDPVYKIDTLGNVIDSFNYFCVSPGDLAFDGSYLWVTKVYDKEIHKITRSGELIAIIDSPANDSSGLACDGRYLWVTSSNTTDNTVYKIDKSGNVVHSFDSPGNGFKGLAFDGTNLWHVDATSKVLYKFDPEGNGMGTFHLPVTGSQIGPRGLTSDGTFLWYSSYYDAKIYQLSFPREVPLGAVKRQTFEFEVTGTKNIVVQALVITDNEGAAFRLENDTCSGQTLLPAASCTFDILFTPETVGKHDAKLLVPVQLPAAHTIDVPLGWTAVEKVVATGPNAMPWIPLLLFNR